MVEKIYVVKRRYDYKYYNNFENVKRYAAPTDQITEFIPNGQSYTLDDYKKELERDRDLNKLLGDGNDESYPNKHHTHILNVIKTYVESDPEWQYNLTNGNYRKILTEKDFLRFIKNNKDCILNFACKSVEDYEHILYLMNYRFIRDGSNHRRRMYYLTNLQKQSAEDNYKKAVNPNRKSQFDKAKENIKKSKLALKKLKNEKTTN